MSATFEIDTEAGVVVASNSALAQAMADLIAAEHRATEADLMEAVSLELDPSSTVAVSVTAAA